MNAAFLTLALLAPAAAEQEKTIPLWPDGAPGATGKEDADKPTLTVFLPPSGKANGTAIILVPGGGYLYVSYEKEGRQPGEWLAERGITAFALNYRHYPKYRYPAPIDDGKRAMRLVRSRAKDFGIDPNKIGMWGWSAGGHLTATVGTHPDDGDPKATDPIEKVSCRPDFLILCYPVITMNLGDTSIVTRRALLGPNPDDKLVEYLSNERHVNEKTPPTFLLHGNADPLVPKSNSEMFYKELQKAKVPAELHILDKASHGFGLAQKDPNLKDWPDKLVVWLKERGMLEKPAKRE
jgi:acetyl esterase/lipase